MKKNILIYLVLFCLLLPQAILATTVSFDLDETLIQSNHLTKDALERARGLGYEIETTPAGQDYIIRPGVWDLLDYAKSLDFDLILFTHNYYNYAQDILDSSGLHVYFDKIKSHEDVILPYNRDYQTYPNHRNITYPQKSFFEVYTKGVYEGLIYNTIVNMLGNHNVQSFFPCTSCAKYPPLYGSRVHIDNSYTHVDSPVDFVGIKVNNFDADELEPLTRDGEYLWVAKIKEDLDYLKRNGWSRLYFYKYNKQPDTKPVAVIE